MKNILKKFGALIFLSCLLLCGCKSVEINGVSVMTGSGTYEGKYIDYYMYLLTTNLGALNSDNHLFCYSETDGIPEYRFVVSGRKIVSDNVLTLIIDNKNYVLGIATKDTDTSYTNIGGGQSLLSTTSSSSVILPNNVIDALEKAASVLIEYDNNSITLNKKDIENIKKLIPSFREFTSQK